MPRLTVAARRYAEAIAGIARQAQSWDQWRRDLAVLGKLTEDPIIQLRMASPRFSHQQKQAMVRDAAGDAISDEARSLVGLMARKGRLDLLPQVLTWFDELADRAQRVKRYTVTSAVPLSADQRSRLQQRLAQPGDQVVLTETVDPEILGGLVIQHEDIIRDYSVRARLEQMRRRLN